VTLIAISHVSGLILPGFGQALEMFALSKHTVYLSHGTLL